MIQKYVVAVCFLAVAVYVLTSQPAQSQTGSGVQTWRHMAINSTDQSDPELARRINAVGAQGWELVDVENFIKDGKTVKTVYYFKSPD